MGDEDVLLNPTNKTIRSKSVAHSLVAIFKQSTLLAFQFKVGFLHQQKNPHIKNLINIIKLGKISRPMQMI